MQLLNLISKKLKNDIKLAYFAIIISLLNFILFHYPFFKFTFENVDYKSFGGIIIIFGLIIIMIVANAMVFYLIFYISRIAGKIISIIFFITNSIALYFINTYSTIMDESMMGNVINTNYDEATSFLSFNLIIYILLFGILPSIYIITTNIIKPVFKRFITTFSLSLLFIIVMIFANATNWLWIDKYSQQLGGLAMPWSYSINIPLYYIHKYKANRKEILLPNATIKNKEKAVVVLVIGESSRRQNFSLYGYKKNTNPMLTKTENVFHFDANSCATYTTAGVKCILEHQNTDKLYEILPNYLYRNNVEVVWRTSNWGEPPIHIKHYQRSDDLKKNSRDYRSNYDEILLTGLKEEILSSDKDKILIILHTSTSHGPTYSKKYPPEFEIFKPVCNSVELGSCSQEELINAYDNTIIYTDYILYSIIEELKQLIDYKSSMIFVSDHGESLGEKNLYMHGVPMSFAPREQYEIPFIVWVSDSSKELKKLNMVSQNHIFHSILNFLSIESPVYNEDMNIFK